LRNLRGKGEEGARSGHWETNKTGGKRTIEKNCLVGGPVNLVEATIAWKGHFWVCRHERKKIGEELE